MIFISFIVFLNLQSKKSETYVIFFWLGKKKNLVEQFPFWGTESKEELPVLVGVRMAAPLLSRGPSAEVPWEYGLPQLRNNGTAVSRSFIFRKL